MPEALTAPQSEPFPSSNDDEGRFVPALVIVWSADEPARIGEVALVDGDADSFVLGRGADGPGARLSFYRQRPGILEPQPPLAAAQISREQLVVRLAEDDDASGALRVVRRGQAPMRVNGAPTDDAIVRPGDTVEIERHLLLYCVERPARMAALKRATVEMPFGEADPDGIVGESPAVWELRDEIATARLATGHVLLLGQSGTGKELAAAAIHARSPRAKGPFVSRNAATIPSGIMDAELFGNARDYPNAGMAARPGIVGEADGGVLFLDEIGDIPAELHAKLLRVLDPKGEYARLGEKGVRRSDFRLIGAMNRDPSVLKHDLLARLLVEVELPPLADRREDVPLIVRSLVVAAAAAGPLEQLFVVTVQGRPEVQMTPALMDGLVRMPLAANIRDLAKMVAKAVAEARGGALDVPRALRATLEKMAAEKARAVRPAEIGADHLRRALDAENQNVSRAAIRLGITRQALQRLRKKHGV